MTGYRISLPAQADLAQILTTSAERWGPEGQRRYAVIIAAAMRRVAAQPNGLNTHDRAELLSGVRSFHVRHVRGGGPVAKVKRPVHVLYYRTVEPGLIEIVRVLHEHMEPRRHVGVGAEEKE